MDLERVNGVRSKRYLPGRVIDVTRYLCAHPSHDAKRGPRPVDLTAQVRLERGLEPRSRAYLAVTEEVVDAMRQTTSSEPTDRMRAALEAMTGEPAPSPSMVILMASANVSRPPALYELDDLRAAEPAVDALVGRLEESTEPGDASDDVIVLGEASDEPDEQVSSGGGVGTEVRRLVRVKEPQILPEGVFLAFDLATRLAAAASDDDALIAAIRSAPVYRGGPSAPATSPWRVLVECPVPGGKSESAHTMLFTGSARPEPPTVHGVPLTGRDALLEQVAATDLSPATSIARSERRLRALIIGIGIVAALLAGLAWITGVIGFTVREVPWAPAVAAALAIASVAIAVVALNWPIYSRGHVDDLYGTRQAYDRRIGLLAWCTRIAVLLFGSALIVAVVAPIWAAGRGAPSLPAPAVTFDTSSTQTIATVTLTARDVASSDTLMVQVSATTFTDPTQTVVARIDGTGDPQGRISIDSPVALPPGAQTMAIQVWFAGDQVPTCTPTSVIGAGCTVLTVPPATITRPPTTARANNPAAVLRALSNLARPTS
jgi:hypothetical protein